jgi:hypothetical protein
METPTNALVAIATEQLGPPDSIDPKALARIAEDAILDRQIAQLSNAGMPYPDIAAHLGLSLGVLIRRVGSLLSARDDLMSTGFMNDELVHQLRLLSELEVSALSDMAAIATEEIPETVASRTRHNGRLALVKALQQRAVISGLIRSRVDIRHEQDVRIAVLRPEDWDAL